MRLSGPVAVDFFRSRFRRLGSAARAAGEQAYMKSALAFHGVSTAEVRRAAKELCAAHPELDHDELRAVVDALYASGYFDLRSAANEILARRPDLLGPRDARWILRLVGAAACWAHVDSLATTVLGRLTTDRPQLLVNVRAWARDPDFWVRRAALLAQLRELRAGRGDFALFEDISVPMLGEKEFFIRKAIGWVLRDVSRKRPELVLAYLLAHGDDASGLTFREASRNLVDQGAPPLGRETRPSLPEELGARLPARPGRRLVRARARVGRDTA